MHQLCAHLHHSHVPCSVPPKLSATYIRMCALRMPLPASLIRAAQCTAPPMRPKMPLQPHIALSHPVAQRLRTTSSRLLKQPRGAGSSCCPPQPSIPKIPSLRPVHNAQRIPERGTLMRCPHTAQRCSPEPRRPLRCTSKIFRPSPRPRPRPAYMQRPLQPPQLIHALPHRALTPPDCTPTFLFPRILPHHTRVPPMPSPQPRTHLRPRILRASGEG